MDLLDFYPDMLNDEEMGEWEELEAMLEEEANIDQYQSWFCRQNPWHPSCRRDRRRFCRENPWHPSCRRDRRDHRRFCRENPWHPSCRRDHRDRRRFCRENPWHPSCRWR
jgi:hypothetical protein